MFDVPSVLKPPKSIIDLNNGEDKQKIKKGKKELLPMWAPVSAHTQPNQGFKSCFDHFRPDHLNNI